MSRRFDAFVQLAGPVLLVVAVGVAGSFTSRATEIYFRNALVAVAVVVAIYVFVGNSGVLSFGQISFAAVGAFAAGVMTVPGRRQARRAAGGVLGDPRQLSSATSPHSRSPRSRGVSSPWSPGCR